MVSQLLQVQGEFHLVQLKELLIASKDCDIVITSTFFLITCSVCPTVFGPQDSYYEHENDVYCHFHYSTRFATKYAVCNNAILKQFVEINRNNRDECWHSECYMINKENSRCGFADDC